MRSLQTIDSHAIAQQQLLVSAARQMAASVLVNDQQKVMQQKQTQKQRTQPMQTHGPQLDAETGTTAVQS